jgi:hypothetical protein
MSKLQEEFAQAAAQLIRQAAAMGYAVTLGEAWRTPQQAQWNADHGTGIAHSLHLERLAIDLNFFRDGALISDGSKLKDIGDWWKALGPSYRWGGDFVHLPDGNHFSISPDGHIA